MKSNLFNLVDTELIYHQAPCGYLSILPNGSVIKINQTLLVWLGYEEDAIVEKLNFTDLLSKGGAMHYEMFFRPIVSVNGNIRELNYELNGAGGRKFPALISARGVMDENSKLVAVNMVITDITQRNLYEKELLQARRKAESEKERFTLLADLSKDMVWTIDHSGEVNYMNREMKEYFGLEVCDPCTPALMKLIHPNDKIRLLRTWFRQNGTDQLFEDRVRFLRNEKSWEWFAVRIIPVREDKTDIKWFGTGTSINEHVVAMERKDEFIHIASHELNTPVTVLKGYLQLIQRGLPADVLQDFIAKGLKSVANLQFLVSSLLNVSVINSGELKIAGTSFLLNSLLKSCKEQIASLTKTHVITLEDEFPAVMVVADRDRIEQVLVNLLSNAVKYSPAANEVVLAVKPLADGNHIRISVRDYGPGIAAAELPKIFDRYYRIKESNTVKGLGLGLYITRNILKAHGTDLQVESEINKGSVFFFDLKLA